MDGGARRPAALGLGASLSDWRSIAGGGEPWKSRRRGLYPSPEVTRHFSFTHERGM